MDFTSLSSNSTCPSNPMMMTTIQPTTCGGSPSTPNKSTTTPSRYGNQKRRDWNTFCQYLRNHRPPVSTAACSGTHVLDFLRYLDQFGKTKVHNPSCPFFGLPSPPAPCPCPLRQAWGSLDSLIGRLRAAYEEHEGKPEANPFGVRAVRIYLKEVRDFQTKARGVSYKKKRKLRPNIINNKQQQQKKLINITPPADHHHHHHHNHHSAAPPCTW